MKKELTVIFTCHNRKEKTVEAMRSLAEGNPQLAFHFIVVDDASTDGTAEAVTALGYDVKLIRGTGELYWCGGMRKGIALYLDLGCPQDCLLINDDVKFAPRAIEKMVEQAAGREAAVIVGATCDSHGDFTYGLRRRRDRHSIWLDFIEPNSGEITGETMNANCVLIPREIMKAAGNLDEAYTHSLGDYDFGFRLFRMGVRLVSSREYVGVCENNDSVGSWQDPTLPRRERLKKKAQPKGLPFREWWHFLYRNFGFFRAVIHSAVPYIKILLGK